MNLKTRGRAEKEGKEKLVGQGEGKYLEGRKIFGFGEKKIP